MSAEGEKIALFIDGANLYATAKSLGFDIDYKRLLLEFQSRGNLIRAFYYTAVIEDQEYSSIRPLIDWLDYNGYSVVTKPSHLSTRQAPRGKGTWNRPSCHGTRAPIDHMVLFSGDGDAVAGQAVQRRGVRVTSVSISAQPHWSTVGLGRTSSRHRADAPAIGATADVGRRPQSARRMPAFAAVPAASAPRWPRPVRAPPTDFRGRRQGVWWFEIPPLSPRVRQGISNQNHTSFICLLVPLIPVRMCRVCNGANFGITH
jgi:uncharacterized LabA/DUF88 family protein